MVFLHGLFGSADNWLTLGKRLADRYAVYLVDQRNHGRSPHRDGHDYDSLANDLKEWLDSENLIKVRLLGHSMGGKTAMRFAQLYPDYLQQVIVVDMGVKAYPPHHQEIVKGLQSLKLDEISSRREAEEALENYIPDFGTRQFLLKNLYRTDKKDFAWRMNIEALERNMDAILSALPKEPRVDRPTLFVSGSKSDYMNREDKDEISEIFNSVSFVELPTGHWVHAEDPDGLEKILRDL